MSRKGSVDREFTRPGGFQAGNTRNKSLLSCTSLTMISLVASWGRHGALIRSASAFSSQRHPCAFVSKARLLSSNPTHTKLIENARFKESSVLTRSSTRSFASSTADEDKGETSKKYIKPKPSKKKFKINPNWKKEADLDALTDAFDKLATKEGFDASRSLFADGASFEDEFDLDGNDDDDQDDESIISKMKTENVDINPDDFDLDDFDFDDESDDDYIDFGSDFEEKPTAAPSTKVNPQSEESMEARIKAAQMDLDRGSVSVPKELDKLSREVSSGDLKKLGYRQELNPFGNDETHRKEQFMIFKDAMVCTGCGSNFQAKDETRPGFLPSEKYDTQVKLSKIEEMQKLQEKAEGFEWSAEDEIEWMIQSQGDGPSDEPGFKTAAAGINIDGMAEDLGLDLSELSSKKVICKRCHNLQNYGEVEEELRPGWTEEPLLSQEAFRDLLRPLREKTAVIIALVDLFDFSGSVLPELDAIVGDNPVLLAANKADLLPSKMGQTRAESWVRRELEYVGVQSLANVGGAVRLVSCKTGFGLSALLAKARNMAEEMDCDVYIIGAANAGKSSMLNFIMEKNNENKAAYKFGKKRPGNANAHKGDITTSPLPGTTLKFIKVDLGNGRALYDTPGLLVPGTLTQRLTPAELKMVVPKKEVEPITLRIASGKCVLIGGLAKIEVIGDSKPFLFTFFVSNDIKLHSTDSDRADEVIAKHAGTFLTPPLEPGPERIEQIGEMESHTVEIEGAGWKEAGADITLRGLGWVAVTGAGTAKVRISVPKGIGISVRPPLMPFDIWEVAAKYTGGRSVRKSGKTKTGKRRGGVGRR